MWIRNEIPKSLREKKKKKKRAVLSRCRLGPGGDSEPLERSVMLWTWLEPGIGKCGPRPATQLRGTRLRWAGTALRWDAGPCV